MVELDIAKEWGLTPWQYDSLESNEKAEMMAFVWVSRLNEAYHYEQAGKSTASTNGRAGK